MKPETIDFSMCKSPEEAHSLLRERWPAIEDARKPRVHTDRELDAIYDGNFKGAHGLRAVYNAGRERGYDMLGGLCCPRCGKNRILACAVCDNDE